MTRKSTFYELKPKTQASHEQVARRVAQIALDEGGIGKAWTKDEIIGHIRQAREENGDDFDERRPTMYLERIRMASILGGPTTPTLDLKRNGRTMSYVWLYDGQIPSDFLDHILACVGGSPRIAFDYFMMLATPDEGGHSQYDIDDLVDGVGAIKALLFLMLVEFYIRINRGSDLKWAKTRGAVAGGIDQYMQLLSQFKNEIQNKVDPDMVRDFNAMASAFLLPAPRD
jgi:hypothetical protein